MQKNRDSDKELFASSGRWFVNNPSSAGICFVWSAIFAALAVAGFVFDIKQQEELDLKSPASINAAFESAQCSTRKGITQLVIRYSYDAMGSSAKSEKFAAIRYIEISADRQTCEKNILKSAAQDYPTHAIYYETTAPSKYAVSIQKRSSFPILLWGLFLTLIPAALGFWRLENQSKNRRKN